MFHNLKPAFRYIGGKRWLKNELNNISFNILNGNKKINTYCEPFAGGLGSLISNYEVLDKFHIKNIIINDINFQLISLYNHLKNKPDHLINDYLKIENKMFNYSPKNFLEIKKQKDKKQLKEALIDCSKFFNEIKGEFNFNKKSNKISNSARLMFLLNHCFNGIYRENSLGEYNTAYNWDLRNPNSKIENIKLLSLFLNSKNVLFQNSSFENLNLTENMLVYCDPPYINLDKNENKYHKEKFSIKELSSLVEKIKNHSFILSHYYEPEIIQLFRNFSDLNFNYEIVERKNKISSDKETRSTIKKEVLIYSK